MSFDFVGGATPVLDIPALPTAAEMAAQAIQDTNIAGASAAIATDEGELIVQPAGEAQTDKLLDEVDGADHAPEVDLGRIPENLVLAEVDVVDGTDPDDSSGPSFIFYDLEEITDSGHGGGYVEIHEPTVYAPEGYEAEDLYAVEFVHDETTGELTIFLHFGAETFSSSALGQDIFASAALSTGELSAVPSLGEISPLQGAGSNCTVTITKTTTQTSGHYTINFNTGIVSGSRTTPSTTKTTTTTISVSGTLQNGRCVVSNGTR